jgi:starch-binding outer membrane protein, SusD/RagB family
MKNYFPVNKYILIVFVVSFVNISCSKKFVQVDPPVTGLVSSVVYSSDATAAAAVNNILLSCLNYGFASGTNSITTYMGMAADELKNYSDNNTYEEFYKNELKSSSDIPFLALFYMIIYQCNATLEGIENSSALTPGLKNQLMGEAKFIRAFIYFYATNLYGELPLVITPNYKINNTLGKSSVSVIYDQIVDDLKDAQNLLPADYYNSIGGVSSERVFPVKAAATALLARVYLYKEDWTNAELQSSAVINNPKYDLTELSQVFKKNNVESIWQLGALNPAPGNGGTGDGTYFILTATPGSGTSIYSVALSQDIHNAFEADDKRKSEWIGTYIDSSITPNVNYNFAYKYKANSDAGQPSTEYLVVLRLAEQYMIRAEANAQLGKFSEAVNDLNKIRRRAGISDTTMNDKQSLLNGIAEENRREFFVEWAHRWFDLKRTKTIDLVMQNAALSKESTWEDYKQLLPLPFNEIKINPDLKQNKGYN